MKSFLIAAFSIVMVTAAVAQVADELPYKEDGPERDYYLRTFVRACVQELLPEDRRQ